MPAIARIGRPDLRAASRAESISVLTRPCPNAALETVNATVQAAKA